MTDYAKLEDMIGVTMRSVEKIESDEIIFTAEDGRQWKLYHRQDCCEGVSIEDVTGNLDDLVGAPLTVAREDTSQPDPGKPSEYAESWTWTFYAFATRKGHVVVRWLGESNGYYSEGVDFAALESESPR